MPGAHPPPDPSDRDPARLGPPRWAGEPGHVDVWYATVTDAASGHALWLHAELRVGLDGRIERHGWLAVFPPAAPPLVDRFAAAGPGPADPAGDWFSAAGVRVGPGVLVGRTEHLAWDLTWRDAARPLYTFPRYAWERDLLPGAQVVPWPTAAVSGSVDVDGVLLQLREARGAVARIAGNRNARRWGWLHADLGDGDVLEVVAAQGHGAVLGRVPPRAFVRLRLGGRDWPPDPLVAAVGSRTVLDLPRWSATVTGMLRRLRVDVDVPAGAAVTLEYRDPDGSVASCTNSCRARADIRLERRTLTGWRPERRWTIRGDAHAEVGRRPDR